MENPKLFGGINILLAGDFMQLPPTKRLSFPTTLINKAKSNNSSFPSSPSVHPFDHIGCELFSQFQKNLKSLNFTKVSSKNHF